MLYKLNQENKKEYSKAKRISLNDIKWKEKDLQNLIFENIQDFIYANDLLPVFHERDGQEEPDILALDKNGDLYILELKRWSSKQENLLQVLRYGQLFGGSTYDELNELFLIYKKAELRQENENESADEFLASYHKKYFALSDEQCLDKSQFNQHQHFLVVTNGLDQDTVEAIHYWQGNGLSIDAIIYWVFEIGGEHYIEFNMYSPVKGYLEYETHNYVLNTNYRYNEQFTKEMLSEQKAAAYSPGWMEKIDRLQKGDTVFLYQNGRGIIAYGQADGNLKKKGNEHYMHLDNFITLAQPLSASEMKRVAEKGFPFPQTLFGISEECKNAFEKEIQAKCLSKA